MTEGPNGIPGAGSEGERAAPLEGVRVLDFSRILAAPLATQTLADFGADVIKVETPPGGDLMRLGDRTAAEQGRESAFYVALNRNKRSVLLDLRSEQGREVVQRLLPSVDVVVHNFRTGVMEQMGLDYATVSAQHPRVIYATCLGFGSRGPLVSRPGQDFLAQALSGMLMRGAEEPRIFPTPIVDFAASMLLVQGLLLALRERDRSGRGQEVTTSLLDASLFMQIGELTARLSGGFRANFHTQSLIDVFKTSDGFVIVVLGFRATPVHDICEALGMEDLSQRPGWSEGDEFGVVPNREEVLDALRPAFAGLSTDEALERMEAHDIPCAPVLDEDEILAHEQTAINGMVWNLKGEDPTMRAIGNPIALSATPPRVTRAPEALGASTAELLAELGLGDAAAR